MEEVRYRNWIIGYPMIVLLTFLGLFTGYREFIVAALIPAAVMLISFLGRKPSLNNLEVERRIEYSSPHPGQEVRVKLRIKNNGTRTIKELRIVDLVPESLRVSKGSPRGSFALTPGSSRTLEYSIIARRGNHVFKGSKVEAPSGITSIVKTKETGGDDEIECKTALDEIMLRDQTVERVGEISTTEGGSGIEFHSLRDYESRDPLSRVEWSHLAKTGELATKNFREEKTGKIILVIDARSVADRKPDKGYPTGKDLCAYAAKRVYKALKRARHNPGIVALGIKNEEISVESDSVKHPFVKPGASQDKTRRSEMLIKQVQKAESHDQKDIRSDLYKLASPNTQFIFFTPLLDDTLVEDIKVLDRHGHSSTVVSPNITSTGTKAAELMSLKRSINVKRAKRFTPVVDWNPKDPMNIEVSKILKKAYSRDV